MPVPGHRTLFRPVLPATAVVVLLTVYFLLAFNDSMWNALWALFLKGAAGGPGFFASLLVVLVCYTALLFTLLMWPVIGKPLISFVILTSSVSAYYMDSYGVAFTSGTVRNVFETNVGEVSALMSTGLVIHVIVFGIVPVLLLAWVRVRYAKWWRTLLYKGVASLILAGVAFGVPATATEQYRQFVSRHHDVGDRFNPFNYVTGTAQYVRESLTGLEMKLQPLGRDATLSPTAAKAPKIVVLVVGETARAANFGLQGYARQTTPELAAANVIYFRDAHSCGTSTAVSVPCMFSRLDRSDFSEVRARNTENLLDILQRAGVDVFWRDNDGGCKDVCARVPAEDATHATIPALCSEGGCLDHILVRDLPTKLATMQEPALIVLHMSGSHGPSYRLRYPDDYQRFTPTCDTAELKTCTHQAVVNSYDNTLLYTDHVLGTIINDLKALPDTTSAALVYLSDHGESLGENGIYVHGAKYNSAPPQQTHIPFLFWFSQGWKMRHPTETACVAGRTDERVGQANLFDTMLGLFDVDTSVYRENLDLTAPCDR